MAYVCLVLNSMKQLFKTAEISDTDIITNEKNNNKKKSYQIQGGLILTVRHVKYSTFTMLRCCKDNKNTRVKTKLKYLCLGLLTIFETMLIRTYWKSSDEENKEVLLPLLFKHALQMDTMTAMKTDRI